MSVRLHVASVGVVMLALAAGLVTGVAGAPGGGPATGTADPGGGPATGTADPGGGTAGGTAEGAVPVVADDVLAEVLPAVVAGHLDGREIAVLTIGETVASTADQVSADIAAAGGRVGVRAALGEDWADSGATGLRSGLARQINASGAAGPGTTGDPDPDGDLDGDALVGLLGAALTGVPGTAPGVTRSTVWGVLTGAGLVSGALDAQARPDSFVVVAPPGVAADSAAGWVSVVERLAGVAPLVLAAPGGAGPAPGEVSLILSVRGAAAAAEVSTVDHAATGLGRVAVVRAAADLPEGVRGHYGSLRGAASGAPDGG